MKQNFVLTVADYFVKISSNENYPIFFEEGYSNFLQLEEVEKYDATVVCHAGLPEESSYAGEVIFDAVLDKQRLWQVIRTEKQSIRYDELTANQRKESKKEIAKPVSTDVNMQIIENFHAKKQVNIYVVKLSDRVERSTYEELNSRAKKLGGYYSSYNKQGAIPGFIFDTLEQAQQFTQVEQATEVVKDSKAQALRELANKLWSGDF